MKELINIQRDLRAPKGQYNTFGKYRYRSAEDILNAVKPLLADNGCTLTMSDDIVLCGSFVYVKATATLVKRYWTASISLVRLSIVLIIVLKVLNFQKLSAEVLVSKNASSYLCTVVQR